MHKSAVERGEGKTLRVALVGPHNVGKHSLAHALAGKPAPVLKTGEFTYPYSDFASVSAEVDIDGVTSSVLFVSLQEYSGGRMDNSFLINLEMRRADAVLVCYNAYEENTAVTQRGESIFALYAANARHNAAKAPIFYVGTQKDRAEDGGKRLSVYLEDDTTPKFECSALTKDGVLDLLAAVIRDARQYNATRPATDVDADNGKLVVKKRAAKKSVECAIL